MVVAGEPTAGFVAGLEGGSGDVGGTAAAALALVADGQEDEGYGQRGIPDTFRKGEAILGGKPLDGGNA